MDTVSIGIKLHECLVLTLFNVLELVDSENGCTFASQSSKDY